MSEKVNFYLPPAEFFEEVLKSKIDGKISNRLGAMFLMLAEKTTNHRYWIRYVHLKDDMIAEATCACVKAFDGFKPLIPSQAGEWDGKTLVKYDYLTCYNPHAWFTTAIMNRLKQFMRVEYNQTNILNKAKVNAGLDPSFGYEEVMEKEFADSFDRQPEETEQNDDIFNFGGDYE